MINNPLGVICHYLVVINCYNTNSPSYATLLQTFGDTYFDAARGFSDCLKFWWHVQFPKSIRNSTLRNLQVLVREKKGDRLVTINVLEFMVEIINYVVVQVYHQENLNRA